jgi:hypothetical protein
VREVFDIGAKDKAELKRSDWLKFDGSLFGGGGDNEGTELDHEKLLAMHKRQP